MNPFAANYSLTAAIRGVLITVALLGIGSAPPAEADTIYTYSGNAYTSCGGTYCTGGPYALRVTFDTTLTGSALDSLTFTDITSTVTSFDFTDGSGLTFNSNTNPPAQLEIEISTNASGNVVAWFTGAYSYPAEIQMQTNWESPVGFIPGADFSETTAFFQGDYGFISDDPGTWAMTVSGAPDRPSAALLATGLLGLLALAARRVGRRVRVLQAVRSRDPGLCM